MQLQIFLHVILITTGIASLIALLVGFNIIRNGRRSPYFRTRQRRIANGWGAIGIAVVLAAIAAISAHFSDPVSTWIFSPLSSSPAATLTTSASQTPQPGATINSPIPTKTPAAVTLTARLPPVSTTSAPLTLTVTITNTLKPTSTPTLTKTHAPTQTPSATPTIAPSRTAISLSPTPAATHAPTKIPTSTLTPYPTWTLSVPSPGPLATHAPTKIPTLTLTPYPTWTAIIPSPTAYSTHAPTPTNGAP